MTKPLSRRTLLRGAGASLALPWLEAMAVAQSRPVRRAAFLYIPNGVMQAAWTPTQAGRTFELPYSLEPLETVRRHVMVVSGLDRTYVSGTGVHAQCGSCWLTSSPPTRALDGGFPTDLSLDQMLAQEFAEDTVFPSLELSCNDRNDNKETRYFESISWIAPGYAANVEKDPRAVFQRLFGDPQKDKGFRTVLDTVLADARGLNAKLGRTDQVKLDEYLTSVRSIEKRIDKATQAAAQRGKPPIAEPEGIPEDRGAYIRLMIDLMIVAFQQDVTRVATLVIDPERWDSPRMYHGVLDKPEDHHGLTHTKGDEAKVKLTRIDRFHVQQYAYLVEKMAALREGESTLLTNSMVALGSGLGDGSIHSYKDLPLLIAGSGGGRLRTGEHVRCNPGTPLANLWLTILQAAGVKKERFADSSRVLTEVLA
jgi:hypothetical protein